MSALPTTELTRKLHVTIEDVTPERAALFLAKVDNPRKLRPNKVMIYARDIAAGRWAVGSSSLKFDPSGALRDGQHRLTACIEADRAFPTVIYWNVTDDAIDNTDRGMNRQWHDVLNGRGFINTRYLQATVALAWRWDNHMITDIWGTRTQLTNAEADEWLGAHPSVTDAVAVSSVVSHKVGGRPSVAGAFLHRSGVIDLDARDRFVESLVSGANLATDDPIHKLRDRLMTDRGYKQRTDRMQQVVELAVMCKTWNAWMIGEPMKQLMWRRGPHQRDNFPDLVDGEGSVYPFPDVVARRDR